MKNVTAILIISLLSNQAFGAKCDYADDIKKVEGGYLYTEGCHIEVGKKVKGFALQEKQIEELNKTIELKDLAMVKQEERTKLWMDTSLQMGDRLNAYEATKSSSQWLHFSLGVVVTGLSVWAASKLTK